MIHKKEIVPCDNDNPLIDPQVVDEVVSNLAISSNEKRRQRFIWYWLIGFSVRQAALRAGYSHSYATKGIYKYIAGPRFWETFWDMPAEAKKKRRYKPKNLCCAKNRDGSPCQRPVYGRSSGNLCIMHHNICARSHPYIVYDKYEE